MDFETIDKFLMALPNIRRNDSFDDGVVSYEVPLDSGAVKLVALVYASSKPLKISLRSDRQLAKVLRERYEEVQPGLNLDQKTWNTIICSGQLANDEIIDLARLSYRLATETIV